MRNGTCGFRPRVVSSYHVVSGQIQRATTSGAENKQSLSGDKWSSGSDGSCRRSSGAVEGESAGRLQGHLEGEVSIFTGAAGARAAVGSCILFSKTENANFFALLIYGEACFRKAGANVTWIELDIVIRGQKRTLRVKC